MVFEKHIFICVNQREPGAARRSCGEAHGLEVVDAFKKRLKELNLPIKLRAQKAGCMDICDFGQTVVIYPEGIFYVGVEQGDVEEIIQEHIIHNRPVERLILENVREKRIR
jgi:(2Fe-2S) ferredoxin